MIVMHTSDIEEKIAVAVASEYFIHTNEAHYICQLFDFLDSSLYICFDREHDAVRWGHKEHLAQTLGDDGIWYTDSGKPVINDWGIEDVFDYIKESDLEEKERITEFIVFNLDALSNSGPHIIMPKY